MLSENKGNIYSKGEILEGFYMDTSITDPKKLKKRNSRIFHIFHIDVKINHKN